MRLLFCVLEVTLKELSFIFQEGLPQLLETIEWASQDPLGRLFGNIGLLAPRIQVVQIPERAAAMGFEGPSINANPVT